MLPRYLFNEGVFVMSLTFVIRYAVVGRQVVDFVQRRMPIARWLRTWVG